MSNTPPVRGVLRKLAYYAFYPVTKPVHDVQGQLTAVAEHLGRIEARLVPLEQWFTNLNQWAHDEGERSKRVLEFAELLVRIREELNANAHVVTEASVYFERAVRELLENRPQPDVVADPEKTRAGR
jgi:hypothetical protein